MTGAAILGCAGAALAPDERAFFREADPWGFILFDRNLRGADGIRALAASLREAVGRAAPIFVDQEGGRVQRLRPPLARDWPPPLDFAAAAGDRAEEAMALRYRLIAHDLRALDLDGNCVPSGDIAFADTHPFLRNRCYAGEPARVARLARAAAEGCLAGGVLPVVKHVPGHGRAAVDSHRALPTVSAARAELDASDFLPFARLADLPLAMTAHVVYAALDDLPATLSPPVIRLIRAELGFDGLLMTDDISMGALGGPVGERAGAALAAGCDVVLHCNGDLAEMGAVAATAGAMAPAAEARAARALARRRRPDPIDMAEAEARLARLTREG